MGLLSECTTVLTGELQKQYYYYRAEVRAGDFEGGEYSFCTSSEAYTIVGDTECEARGYVTEQFAEINTGPTAKGFTFTIDDKTGGVADAMDSTDSGSNGTVVDNMAEVGAGLEFCNTTSDVQAISIGYEGPEGWTSEGWWNVDPDACVTPTLDGVNHRYFYYRAEVDGGEFEGASYFFCTTPEAYTIVGDSECEARGYDREDFLEIDTGGTDGMYTFTLVAADNGSNDPVSSTEATDGGLNLDRSGKDERVDPEVAPEATPEPEPEPEPEIVPDTGKREPTRRGGSRGG